MVNSKVMKQAVSNYVQAAERAAGDIKTAREQYNDTYTREAIKGITSRLAEKRDNALSEIAAAENEGIRAAEAWGKIDGSKIHPDADLLKYGVSPEEFSELVQRHHDNATMQRILFQFAEKENAKAAEHLTGPIYDVSRIESAKSRAHEWQVAGDHARSVLNMFTGEGLFQSGPMAREAYRQFINGEPEYFSFDE